MTAKRLLIAFGSAMLLVVLAWWLELERPRREAERAEAAARLLDDPAALEELRVLRSGETYTMRPAADGRWTLASSTLPGDELVADVRAVRMLREGLERTRAADLSGGGTDERPPSEFGLAPERLRVEWTTPAGTRSFVVGSPVPPDGARVYGLLDGRLVTVEQQLAAVSAWGLDHWRWKTLLNLHPDDIRRIELYRAPPMPPGVSERLVIGKDQHPRGTQDWWRVLEPVDVPALPARLRSLFSIFQRLEAYGFVADHPTQEQLVETGLLPPRASVTLLLEDGTRRELLLGEPRELTEKELATANGRELLAPVHARLDGGPVVTIRPDLPSSVVLEDSRFRDNRALPMPVVRITSFRFEKPRPDGEPIRFEMHRELEGVWRAVLPADAPLPPDEATLVVSGLQSVQFGRFEDEIAADPAGFEAAYDLSGPDSFIVQVQAIDLDGRQQSLLVEAAPEGAILRDRDPYRPVRITDQAGRRLVGVAKFRAFDKFLDRLRELRLGVQGGAPLDPGP